MHKAHRLLLLLLFVAMPPAMAHSGHGEALWTGWWHYLMEWQHLIVLLLPLALGWLWRVSRQDRNL